MRRRSRLLTAVLALVLVVPGVAGARYAALANALVVQYEETLVCTDGVELDLYDVKEDDATKTVAYDLVAGSPPPAADPAVDPAPPPEDVVAQERLPLSYVPGGVAVDPDNDGTSDPDQDTRYYQGSFLLHWATSGSPRLLDPGAIVELDFKENDPARGFFEHPITVRDCSLAPGTPTDVSATAGDGSAEVSFSPAGALDGYPVTGYVVRAFAGQTLVETTTAGASPVTVTGLDNGTAYTFTVAAVNRFGEGQQSIPSAPVTPTGPPDPDPDPEPTVVRIDAQGSGDVRRVAIEVCHQLVPGDGDASRVLLARDDVFADALAGAPLAGRDGCILFTEGGPDAALDGLVRQEIDRVLGGAGQVAVLGGTLAVSTAVEEELVDAGYDVSRFSGESRFETAVGIAAAVQDEHPTNTAALLAYGLNWPDAITGGALGAAAGVPILLTPRDDLHPAAAEAFSDLGLDTTAVLGGTAVISDQTLQQAPDATRVSGSNRMATAVAIADDLWAQVTDVNQVVVVNLERDDAWVLALAAAPLSAALGAPQLGARADDYPSETAGYIQAVAQSAVLVGNEDFISQGVADAIASDL